jgi:hypothetical protein
MEHLPQAGATNCDSVVEIRMAHPETFRSLRNLSHNSTDWFHYAILHDESLYMRWDDWGEFLVSPDGGSVLCSNLSNMTPSSFEAYVTTFAISSALLQRGEEPLHATVVNIGDSTVGLVGQSGAGKSTLAAKLISTGATLVTDDMLRVTFKHSVPFAHPGPFRLKLSKESAEQCMDSPVFCGRFCPVGGKLILQLGPPIPARSTRQLSALFQIEDYYFDDSNIVSVKYLSGIELFAAISSATMNSRVNSRARLRRQFSFAERLAKSIPVYKLRYKKEYRVLDDVVTRVIETTTAL